MNKLQLEIIKKLLNNNLKKKKDIIDPIQVASQDIIKPIIKPKELTFKATKKLRGNMGIKDSSIIIKKPNKYPPLLIILLK